MQRGTRRTLIVTTAPIEPPSRTKTGSLPNANAIVMASEIAASHHDADQERCAMSYGITPFTPNTWFYPFCGK